MRILLPVLVLAALQPTAFADSTAPTIIPIGPAYAATAVNASVFRINALVSDNQYQFVAYYGPDGHIVVGRRELAATQWDLLTLPATGNVRDAHNVVVIGISGDGLLHLAYDHHATPLHYRISEKPRDIHSFGPERAMTGADESHVTYPQFISAPDGSLYFFYRDGASGNGNLCVNRYDEKGKSWKAIAHPLIDGEGKRNPYWWRPAIGADGRVDLAWCWRDSPDAQTNHNLCFAQSVDGGQSWLTSSGKSQPVPITLVNADVADPIPRGQNLINQCSAAVDDSGHPHLVQYFNDAGGIPQYFHIWHDGKKWITTQIGRRTQKFTLGGAGTLAIPISRPEIAISHAGNVYVITRQSEFGNGIHLYQSAAPYQSWNDSELVKDDLGNWEPTYDLSRWRTDNVLSLFVLPVEQGNHEHVTDFTAQTAKVVEVKLR